MSETESPFPSTKPAWLDQLMNAINAQTREGLKNGMKDLMEKISRLCENIIKLDQRVKEMEERWDSTNKRIDQLQKLIPKSDPK